MGRTTPLRFSPPFGRLGSQVRGLDGLFESGRQRLPNWNCVARPISKAAGIDCRPVQSDWAQPSRAIGAMLRPTHALQLASLAPLIERCERHALNVMRITQ
jgi:hypothetical protein